MCARIRRAFLVCGLRGVARERERQRVTLFWDRQDGFLPTYMSLTLFAGWRGRDQIKLQRVVTVEGRGGIRVSRRGRVSRLHYRAVPLHRINNAVFIMCRRGRERKQCSLGVT